MLFFGFAGFPEANFGIILIIKWSKKGVKVKNKTVVLGFGSLIWDKGSLGPYITDFFQGGPVLPLEFSRASGKRKGALTLVVDDINGAWCPTRFAISSRLTPEVAAIDLADREKTSTDCIGKVERYEGQDIRADKECCSLVEWIILKWLEQRGFKAAVWTALSPNYRGAWTVKKAINYLKRLPGEGQRAAADYIRNAPPEVVTPLRREVEKTRWYKGLKEIR